MSGWNRNAENNLHLQKKLIYATIWGKREYISNSSSRYNEICELVSVSVQIEPSKLINEILIKFYSLKKKQRFLNNYSAAQGELEKTVLNALNSTEKYQEGLLTVLTCQEY